MRRSSGSVAEELAQRLEVGGLGGRVLEVLDHVAHRRRPHPEAERGEADREQRRRPASLRQIGRPQSAHSITGPPNRAPRRTALPPIGVSSGSAMRRAEPVQRDAPAQRALLARQQDQADDREQRDRQVGAGAGTAPSRPPGTPRTGTRGGMNAAAAIAMPSQRLARSPLAASATATPGHRQEQPRDRAAERREDREDDRQRVAAALQARAAPRGRRRRRSRTAAGAVNSSVAVLTPNQIEPQRARSSPKAPRASGGNSAAQATAATASAPGGVISQPSGGEMIE